MDASRSEIDTFKVMSNADFVDWSKATLAKTREPHVVLEADDSDDERSDSSRSVRSADKPPPPAVRDDDALSHRSGSSRSSRSSRRSAAEDAAEVPLPASRVASTSPPPPPLFVAPVSAPPVFEPPSLPSVVDPPKRTLPVPKKYTASEENEDYEVRQEKEALLQDILTYERPPHNVKLTRQWNVDLHTLDELQFEYDRIQSELNANQMVEMAKSGIKFGVGGIEMFLKQSGFHAVDGWYKNSCNDMNKYNRPLIKLYKRYWRKTSMSPVMELAFLMFGGLAWTVFENKILRGAGFAAPTSGAAAPSVSVPPRATEYEPPAAPRPGGMRPPSLGSAVRGPRWTADDTATPTPVSAPPAPAPSPAPAPAPSPPSAPATDPALLSALNSLSQQNTLMMQALQSIQTARAPSRHSTPSRHSVSSRSSGRSNLRFAMKHTPLTPKSRGTARQRKDGGVVMAL